MKDSNIESYDNLLISSCSIDLNPSILRGIFAILWFWQITHQREMWLYFKELEYAQLNYVRTLSVYSVYFPCV